MTSRLPYVPHPSRNGISPSTQSLAYAEPSVDQRARDRQLTEIANNIAALAELFKDLSVLVIDQGTLLDSVEYNIEQTAVHMQDSIKELEMATRFVSFACSIYLFSRLPPAIKRTPEDENASFFFYSSYLASSS